MEWRGENSCKSGEYTTTFGGTCIAVFKLLPQPDPADVMPSPDTPTVQDTTQPPQSVPTPPDVTQPTLDSITVPVVTEPSQPVEVNYVGFSDQAYTATENAGSVDITINRIGTTGSVRVDLLSSDDSGFADTHYRSIEQTLFWAKGDDTAIKIPVEIIDNSEIDGDKNVILSLGNVANAELRLGTVVLTIVDDDDKPQVVVKPEPPKYTLIVTTTGEGHGSVASNKDGITCGDDCSQDYLSGTEINLITRTEAGSIFAGWAGDCSGDEGNFMVVMDAAKRCTAKFAMAPIEESVIIIEEPIVIIEEPIVTMPDESATSTTVSSGPASIGSVACNTSDKLAVGCDAHVETITYQEVGEHGNLTGGTLDHPLTNAGLVSNTKITPTGSLKGGKVSGVTNNEGLIENVEFVGASISGKNADGEVVGTIGGKIILASQIGGVVEDVRLAPDTQIVGSGTPKVGSERNIDSIGGLIIGDSEKPAILERLHIKTKSRVSNVIIAENVTYGEDVTFTNVEFRTKVIRKVTLKGRINGTRFKETYTKVESVTIRANSHLSNLDIGDNVVFEAGVTRDDSVTFSVHQRYMESHTIAALPNLNGIAALDSQRNNVLTWAKLQGGARFGAAGSRYRKIVTFKRSKRKNVEILGNVLTDVRHIGLKADILVVAAHTPPGTSSPSFYMLDRNGTPVLWDGAMSSLIPFRAEVTLAPVVPVSIWNNPVDIVGDVQVYFGYRLEETKTIVYSLEDVIEMKFTE